MKKKKRRKDRAVQSEARKDEKPDYGGETEGVGGVRRRLAAALKRRGTRVITASGRRPTCGWGGDGQGGWDLKV